MRTQMNTERDWIDTDGVESRRFGGQEVRGKRAERETRDRSQRTTTEYTEWFTEDTEEMYTSLFLRVLYVSEPQ